MGKIALRNLGSALLYLEKEIVRSKGSSLVSLTSPNIVRADQYIRRFSLGGREERKRQVLSFSCFSLS